MEAMTEDRTKYLLNEKGIRLLFEAAFEFIEDFSEYDSGENGGAILAALKSTGKTEMSLNEFQKIFKALVATRRIITNDERSSLEQEEADALRADQIAAERAETARIAALPSPYELFYADATSAQTKELKRTDPEFAEWLAKKIQSEVSTGTAFHPESSAVTITGAVPQTTGKVHSALKKFADAYNATPAASLKPRNGRVIVGDEVFDITKFNQLLAEASAAHLIR